MAQAGVGMTWTKLGDEFGDECWTLSDNAFRLHCYGLMWSNRMLTDGILHKDDMPRWAKSLDAADELVACGFWENHGEHYQIIHHIGYQPTAESVRKMSKANRENVQKRWAKRRAQPKSSEGSSNHTPYGSYNDSQYDSQYDGDGTGTGSTCLEKEPNYVSPNGENNGFPNSAPGNEFDGECAEYSAAVFEPPTTDRDGNPLDDGGH